MLKVRPCYRAGTAFDKGAPLNTWSYRVPGLRLCNQKQAGTVQYSTSVLASGTRTQIPLRPPEQIEQVGVSGPLILY